MSEKVYWSRSKEVMSFPDLFRNVNGRLELFLGEPTHGCMNLDRVAKDSDGKLYILSHLNQESEPFMTGPSRSYIIQIGTPDKLIKARTPFVESANPIEAGLPDVQTKTDMLFKYNLGRIKGIFIAPYDDNKPPMIYQDDRGNETLTNCKIIYEENLAYPRKK